MAVGINNKVGFKIGSSSPATIDLSDWVTNFTLDDNYDTVEVTAMGDTSHKVVKGLYSGSLTIDFLNDGADNATLQTLSGLIGTTAYFKAIKDADSAVAATNVLYSGQIFVNGLQPINGAVGDIASMSVTFVCQTEPTRAITGTW